jgi:predicted nucleotidyltransferase
MLKNKKELEKFILKNSSVIKGYGVKRLGLFGSFVHDKATKNSDVDFLVEFEAGKKNYDNFINLCFYFEDNFQRKVELITKKSISPFLKPYILNDIKFYEI